MTSPIIVNPSIQNNKSTTFHNFNQQKKSEEFEPNENDFLTPMFSVPILHLEVRNWEKKKKELLRIHEYTKSNAITKAFNDVQTDYHYNGENPHTCYSQEIFKILEEEISIANSEFIPEHPNPEEQSNLGMENSWFETSTKGSQHQVHNHGPCGVSAVCYIEFDKEVHEPTHFINPFFSYYSGDAMYYAPWGAGEGSILFWPAPVLHFTQPNSSDKERLVLSFNLSIFAPNGEKKYTV